MTIITLVRFLFTGSAESIRAIAASRGALWLGLIFVLSAGLAREYDGEYLPAKPWVLVIPFVASISLSFVLFSIFWLFSRRPLGMPRPAFLPGYRMFATVFLITAPLAWLYAIPYERFLSPLDATTANLWTLALVALWRVLLTVRMVRVLFGSSMTSSVVVLMAVACAAVLVSLSVTPTPVFQIMDGIRYAPRDQMIASTAFLVSMIFMLSLPFLCIAAGTTLRLDRADWPMQRIPVSAERMSLPLKMLGVMSIVAWLAILPMNQTEQRLRHKVELDVFSGRYPEALAMMSKHARADFPPLWDPPPRFGYPDEPASDVVQIMDAILDHPPAQWVANIYTDKFMAYAQSPEPLWEHTRLGIESGASKRFINLLQRLPAGKPWDELRKEVGGLEPAATSPTRTVPAQLP